MAVRRRLVRPDAVLETQTYGEVPYVTDGAYLEAVVAAAQTQALAGGVLTILVQRHATDFDGEMVSTAAVIEWKDRTDAKPQPEPHTDLPQTDAIPQPGLFEPTEIGDDEEPVATEAVPLEDEEEDLSSVPAELR